MFRWLLLEDAFTETNFFNLQRTLGSVSVVIYEESFLLSLELLSKSHVNVLFRQQLRPIKVIGAFKVLRELLSRPIGKP